MSRSRAKNSSVAEIADRLFLPSSESSESLSTVVECGDGDDDDVMTSVEE